MFTIERMFCFIIIITGFLMPQTNAQSNLVLQDITVSTTETYNAGNSITAGPNFTVTGTGDVTFGTPTVILRGSFVITSGGQFCILDQPNGLDALYDPLIPTEFMLKQNYPNPFNPSTTIEFTISKQEFVFLKIYNLLGQEVATLVSDNLTPGNYKYTWNASGFASGIYYYGIEAGSFTKTKKLIVLK